MKKTIYLIALLTIPFILTNCEKKDDDDNDIPIVPLTGPLNIFIEWQTDPDRFGEGGGLQWWGKADITVTITNIKEVSDGYYTMEGEGSGNQYACDVTVPSPYWVENLNAPSFTVEVETGVFARGVGYAFTLWTENAYFTFDMCRDDDGVVYRSTEEPDELMDIINGSLILDLPEENLYVGADYDTTILGTAYHVVASFAEK
ncbi:MAG: hypothetical protein A2Y87_10540 [Bacteroidetes bacterium RBG_13_46_8]|nr:MAG: hypothetical protein A2Y87_10540 [Bacteroidetes bacterium RBG_13_46_8]